MASRCSSRRSRTGVKDNGLGAQATPEKDGCVALLLKQAGYATAVAGKWRQWSHFTTKADGAKWGFDEFLIWGAGVPDDEGEVKAASKAKKAKVEAKSKSDRYWSPDDNLNGSVPIGTVGGRPVDGKKHTMLEGGSRVPLIVNWPGTTAAGVVRKDLVDFSDMLPTFAELAGAKPAQGLTIDGRSFAPQLRGEKGQPREWAYVHLGNQRSVRSDRWKLTGDGELFDRQDAPFRQIPVAADTGDSVAKAARTKLQAALDGPLAKDFGSTAPVKKKKAQKNQAVSSVIP